jgi:SNF2 family DNA or RNA helicase
MQVSQFKWIASRDATEKVHRLMQPSVRFSLEDCVDMPPQIEIDREVTLGPVVTKLYNEMIKELTVMVDNHEITAVNAGVLRGKLMQLASGVVYDKDKRGVVVDDSDRFAICRELLEQTDRPALIFCPWRSLVDHVYDKLKTLGYHVHKVYGGTSKGDRDIAFNDIQNPRSGLHGVVAHPGTMSHGLSLHGADTVIWYALIDNLETYLQANARVERPGQTADHTRVCHLYGSRVERGVLSKLRTREGMQNVLLEMFQK